MRWFYEDISVSGNALMIRAKLRNLKSRLPALEWAKFLQDTWQITRSENWLITLTNLMRNSPAFYQSDRSTKIKEKKLNFVLDLYVRQRLRVSFGRYRSMTGEKYRKSFEAGVIMTKLLGIAKKVRLLAMRSGINQLRFKEYKAEKAMLMEFKKTQSLQESTLSDKVLYWHMALIVILQWHK